MLTVRGQQHSFSTYELVFLWKCERFWDRKCLDLRGDSNVRTDVRTFAHILMFLVGNLLWHRQAIFKSKGDKLSSPAECSIRTLEVWHTKSPAGWMPTNKPTELSRIKQKLKLDSPSHIHTCMQTYIHSYIHTHIHTYIFIGLTVCDALAQGNAYKPTREPIDYNGHGRDRTHDLQTEAIPPAASCPARSGMHRCQFQHLRVLILNCALALAIYIFVDLIVMLWYRETHTNP